MRIARDAMVALAALLVACSGTSTDKANDRASVTRAQANLIDDAMSAGPDAIARSAAIVVTRPNGALQNLRRGGNGWSCAPSGSMAPAAMCMDSNAAKWIDAWRGQKPPPAGGAGVVYMLSTGIGTGGLRDAAAKGACAEVGPHIMIVGVPDLLTGRPAGPRRGLRSPFVMSSGTPYAHLVILVG